MSDKDHVCEYHKCRKKVVGITVVAGSITGAIECCLTYPLEYLKTVMQLYPKMSRKGLKYTFQHT